MSHCSASFNLIVSMMIPKAIDHPLNLYVQVQTLTSPSPDEFRRVFESVQPNFVYFQGEQLQNDEVGSLVWGGVELSSAEDICGLFGSKLPTTVCDISLLNLLSAMWVCGFCL